MKKTFVPPYPLRSGLVLGATFSYSVFPDILQKNLAPKRDIPKLVAGPELARLHGSVSSTFKSSILGSNAHAKLLFEKDQRDKMEASVADAASRYSVFIRGVVRFQSYFRMRRPRLSYLRILEAALKIETAFRAMMSYRITRMSGAKKFTCSIKIQSRVRSFLARRYYIRILLAVKTISKFKSMFMAVTMRKVKLRKLIKLQMFCRRRFLRRKWQLMRCMAVVRKAVRNFLRLLRYRRYNNAAIRLQAFLRGRVRYVVLKKQRTSYLSVMRNMLVTLWRLDNTKLLYRSNFWILLGGDSENCSNFNVKLHELELSRLIVDLGLFGSVLNQKESFSAHIDTLQSLIDRPADLANRIQRSNPNLLKRAAALKEERLLIYRAMKGETDDHARIIFFEKFGISHAKKRKQTLSDRVWSEGSNADDSAAAVRGILSNVYEDMQWLQAVRAERLQADVLSVASALLYRVQHNKKKRSRRTSLLAPLPSSPPTTKNGLIMSPKIKSFS